MGVFTSQHITTIEPLTRIDLTQHVNIPWTECSQAAEHINNSKIKAKCELNFVMVYRLILTNALLHRERNKCKTTYIIDTLLITLYYKQLLGILATFLPALPLLEHLYSIL